MIRGLEHGRTLALLAACAAIALVPPRTLSGAHREHPAASAPSITGIAAQLGIRVHLQGEDTFAVGTSFTGSLRNPDKLSALGVGGMHVGARVTVVRMGPDRVLIDADEDEPAPQRKTARLRMEADGTLAVTSKV